jgi:AcrR family transcriptional regulator
VPIEEIAKAAGLARGLIYRYFESKDELYVLTVTEYLREIRLLLADTDDPSAEPEKRLGACVEAYARYCLHYPAYVDASLSLMQGPVAELRERVSDSVWLQLGTAMASTIDRVTSILRDGADAGAFELTDADFIASVIWTQTLGTMHLARLGVGVKRGAGGLAELFDIDSDRLIATCVTTAMSATRDAL